MLTTATSATIAAATRTLNDRAATLTHPASVPTPRPGFAFPETFLATCQVRTRARLGRFETFPDSPPLPGPDTGSLLQRAMGAAVPPNRRTAGEPKPVR